MNITSFLNHYDVTENPFRAEEAWQDVVFSRIETDCRHPDFEKICGDFQRPSSAIVFGERGSGKTAIRMQVEDAVEAYNRDHPDARCLVVAYDDLNPVLDRFHRHRGKASPTQALEAFKLVDHMDAILASATGRLVDQMVGDLRGGRPILQLGADLPRRLRHMDRGAKRDMLLLQLCYDRPELGSSRTARMKRALRYRSTSTAVRRRWDAIIVVIAALLVVVGYLLVGSPDDTFHRILWLGPAVILGAGAALLGLMSAWMWLKTQKLAHQLHRALRVMDRSTESFRSSLLHVRTEDALEAGLPRGIADEPRYAMFTRLRGALAGLGYTSIIVLVDRVDEPTLVSGEPERMKALVWPLLNNKFLQQDGIGFKLLLPLELRYRLNRETPDLFREARLDKQNFIDRLSWSGATLYDLCTARLNACHDGDTPLSLMEFFEAGITHQDIVDALDQMQQPRDAFKFLYALLQEHCSNVPEEQPSWKIARPTLDAVRKRQTERVSAMLRGVQPA